MSKSAPTTPSLREIREQRGLSLDAVAVLAGVHKSTVSRLERGLIEPSPETVVAIAEALGVSASRARRLTRGRPSIVLPDASSPREAGSTQTTGKAVGDAVTA
jgi:transcriptional regulator with XRE-family HTH domain